MILITNELVTQWKPLIYMLLGKRGRKYTKEEMDDLYVDVVIEMMRNAQYYNGKYAIGTWIELQVRSAMSRHTKGEAEDPMSHVVTSEIPDELDDEVDDIGLEFLQEQIAPFLDYLEDVERHVFVDRVWNKLSVADIADARDLHEKSVSRIMTRATNKLKAIVAEGKRVSPYREVYTDVPLEHAIKIMDDAHYHTFRMHHFEGYPLVLISKINGMSIDRNFQLLSEAKQFIEQEWGLKV